MRLCGDVREECHVARAFDGLHDVALLIRGDAGALLREHLRVWIGEELQIRDIFVVDKFLYFYFFSFSLVCHIE